MHSKSQQKQNNIKISIRGDILYIKGSDQWKSRKTSTKQVQHIKKIMKGIQTQQSTGKCDI